MAIKNITYLANFDWFIEWADDPLNLDCFDVESMPEALLPAWVVDEGDSVGSSS